MQIVVSFRDANLSAYANRLEQIAAGSGKATLAAALNAGGKIVRSQTIAAETQQTGLGGGTITRAQKEIDASAGSLRYTITAGGGNVRLKYFGAAEGSGGVSAHPWNRSTFYPGAFISSGLPGHRSPSAKLGGQVYRNISGGRWRGKIKIVKSGLFIPTEMTQGQTAAAFNHAAGAVLASTVVSRLGALLP